MRAEVLEGALTAIYEAIRVPPEEAAVVARHQTLANLVGHDSHGAIRTNAYVARIERGDIVPGAPFEIEVETDTTAVINGNWGFGFVQTERATQLAIRKAKAEGLAALTIRYQGHIGRLGAYMEMVAAAGMIGLITADSGMGPKSVVPHGGRSARLGTNPISFGIPTGSGVPLILDMATSAASGGKIQLARNNSEKLKKGLLIDAMGHPTTDPNAYYAGGALLPLGGDQGYKGYGLSVVVEILSGLLTGLGFGVQPSARHNDGCFLAVFDVERLRPLTDFLADVDAFVTYLKETPPADGHAEVLYPGELEARTLVHRRTSGILIDDQSWAELAELISRLGLAPLSSIGKR